MTPFEAGRAAALSGHPIDSNPFICGTTKLGNPKFSDLELGAAWEDGHKSAIPPRICSEAENAAARSVDPRRFRRKDNRCYEK